MPDEKSSKIGRIKILEALLDAIRILAKVFDLL